MINDNNGSSENASRDDHGDWAAISSIVEILKQLNDESKSRVLNTVCTFLNLDFGHSTRRHSANSSISNISTNYYDNDKPRFSEDRTLSAKEFLMEKMPKTDIERVACLGYYLAHYKDTPHFKTIDISKLNTEAAQRKFANPAKAVDNASQAGYLVPSSTKAHKQLSASGERFVQALPDRDEAKNVSATLKPKKSAKSKNKSKINRNQEDSEND